MLFARRCCCRQTGGRVGDTQEGEGVAEIQPRRLSAEDACRDVAKFLPDGPAADDQEAGGGDPQQDVPGAGGGRLGPRLCRGLCPSDRGRSPSGLPWQTFWETRRTPTGLCCRSSPRLPIAATSRSRVRARWPAAQARLPAAAWLSGTAWQKSGSALTKPRLARVRVTPRSTLIANMRSAP